MFMQYTIGEALKNVIFLLRTKVFFPKARLIRFPFLLRGKEHFDYGSGLTMGYFCRFDLGGKGITLEIGQNVKLNDRVHIVAHESVSIGSDVLMASNIFISDTSHGGFSDSTSDPSIPPDRRSLITVPVVIGDKVWIGEGVCVLPGAAIPDGCVVGANAVVAGSFSGGPYILAGVPARIIKEWDYMSNRWVKPLHGDVQKKA